MRNSVLGSISDVPPNAEFLAMTRHHPASCRADATHEEMASLVSTKDLSKPSTLTDNKV